MSLLTQLGACRRADSIQIRPRPQIVQVKVTSRAVDGVHAHEDEIEVEDEEGGDAGARCFISKWGFQ